MRRAKKIAGFALTAMVVFGFSLAAYAAQTKEPVMAGVAALMVFWPVGLGTGWYARKEYVRWQMSQQANRYRQ